MAPSQGCGKSAQWQHKLLWQVRWEDKDREVRPWQDSCTVADNWDLVGRQCRSLSWPFLMRGWWDNGTHNWEAVEAYPWRCLSISVYLSGVVLDTQRLAILEWRLLDLSSSPTILLLYLVDRFLGESTKATMKQGGETSKLQRFLIWPCLFSEHPSTAYTQMWLLL